LFSNNRNSGTDQDLEYPGAYAAVPDMLQKNLITNETLNRAVGDVDNFLSSEFEPILVKEIMFILGNVLRQKFALGLFDNNASLLYVDPQRQARLLMMIANI